MLLYVVLQSPISAQLTIGSATEPLSGVLLDIKNTADGYSDKGLLLPRVQLKDRKSLTPLLTESGAMNADSLAYHRGLTVYNLTKSDNLCPGVYTWNGQLWVELNSIQGNVYKGDTESNSFIVPINAVIDIPVEKAYRFWSEYQTPPLSKNTFPNKKLSELRPGVVKAVLLWEDSPGLVSNVSSVDNHLFLQQDSISAVIGKDKDAYIRVEPRYNPCDTTGGNALIALTIDGVIYWNWHIWYTNYDPNLITDTLPNNAFRVNQGLIYRYNNGFSTKSAVFMDRNLGALSSGPGDKLSIGLLYQWGRKDPYPGIANFNTNASQNIYDAKNGNKPLSNSILKKINTELFNLANAIFNPMVIYTSNNGKDWYTSAYDYTLKFQNLLYQNNYLWDYQGQKTYFDPCPKGWRVPYFINGLSPWFNSRAFLENGSVGQEASATFNNTATHPLNYGGTYNNGWIFKNPNYNIGYYPNNQNGNIGLYHTSKTFARPTYNYNQDNIEQCVPILYFTDKYINIKEPQSNPGRETLGALRCVHE